MWGAANVALSFLTGPAGRLLLIALAFFAWGLYQRIDATADCEEAELRRQLEEAQRQAQIANEIAAESRSRADSAEADMARLKGLADELSEDIQDAGNGCRIDPDIRERLRSIK